MQKIRKLDDERRRANCVGEWYESKLRRVNGIKGRVNNVRSKYEKGTECGNREQV